MKRSVTALLLICLLLACISPAAFADQEEKPLTFTTLTLDGKEITSKELFQGHPVTVINVWATWCKPCIGELEELSKLHTKLQKHGCGVVGVLLDGDTALEEGQAIVEEKGVNYPIVLPCDEMGELTEITVFPTTFFVDSEGRMVAEAISGAKVEEYEKTVLSYLNKKAAWAGISFGASSQSDGSGNSGQEPASTADTAGTTPTIINGMMLVCEGDSCTLVPVGETDTGGGEAQAETEESYPVCPITVEYVSETEVIAHAAGEYAGMDG